MPCITDPPNVVQVSRWRERRLSPAHGPERPARRVRSSGRYDAWPPRALRSPREPFHGQVVFERIAYQDRRYSLVSVGWSS